MIGVQPNLRAERTRVCHSFSLPAMCPVSQNPFPGSVLEVHYTPDACYLEIETLGAYIAEYVGGRGGVRDMEQVIQSVAADCAASVGVRVVCVARLKIADDPEGRTRVRDYRVIVCAEP